MNASTSLNKFRIPMLGKFLGGAMQNTHGQFIEGEVYVITGYNHETNCVETTGITSRRRMVDANAFEIVRNTSWSFKHVDALRAGMKERRFQLSEDAYITLKSDTECRAAMQALRDDCPPTDALSEAILAATSAMMGVPPRLLGDKPINCRCHTGMIVLDDRDAPSQPRFEDEQEASTFDYSLTTRKAKDTHVDKDNTADLRKYRFKPDTF